MRRSLLLLPLGLAFVVVAGCGQKGPLVLPPAKPTPQTTPATVAPPSASTAPTPVHP
jgi:predicted small lipoprotein YifL